MANPSTPRPTPDSRPWRVAALVLYVLAPVANYASAWVAPVESRASLDEATYLDPAAYAFGIWALIFLGMIGHSVYQLRAAQVESRALYRASVWICVAALASILFVPVTFVDLPWLSLADILLHFGALVAAYGALRQQARLVPADVRLPYAPVSVFLGWISVALVVSTAKTLRAAGWAPDEATSRTLAVAVVLVVMLLGLWRLRAQRDGLLAATLAWGLAAIAVEQAAVPLLPAVAWAAAGVLVLAVVLQLARGRGWSAFAPG